MQIFVCIFIYILRNYLNNKQINFVMIGTRIKTVVENLGLTPTEFATLLGKNRQYVNQLYNSKGINTNTLELIAKALNQPVNVFFDDNLNIVNEPAAKYNKSNTKENELLSEVDRLKNELIELQKTVIKLMQKQAK